MNSTHYNAGYDDDDDITMWLHAVRHFSHHIKLITTSYKLVGTNYTMSFNMLPEQQFEQICALIPALMITYSQ